LPISSRLSLKQDQLITLSEIPGPPQPDAFVDDEDEFLCAAEGLAAADGCDEAQAVRVRRPYSSILWTNVALMPSGDT